MCACVCVCARVCVCIFVCVCESLHVKRTAQVVITHHFSTSNKPTQVVTDAPFLPRIIANLVASLMLLSSVSSSDATAKIYILKIKSLTPCRLDATNCNFLEKHSRMNVESHPKIVKY